MQFIGILLSIQISLAFFLQNSHKMRILSNSRDRLSGQSIKDQTVKRGNIQIKCESAPFYPFFHLDSAGRISLMEGLLSDER